MHKANNHRWGTWSTLKEQANKTFSSFVPFLLSQHRESENLNKANKFMAHPNPNPGLAT